MNTPTTLKLGKNVRQNRIGNPLASLIANVQDSVRGRQTVASKPVEPQVHLGETVEHPQFGSGKVKAHWPDGALLVRFDREARSRLVFPSLLQGVNGRYR